MMVEDGVIIIGPQEIAQPTPAKVIRRVSFSIRSSIALLAGFIAGCSHLPPDYVQSSMRSNAYRSRGHKLNQRQRRKRARQSNTTVARMF